MAELHAPGWVAASVAQGISATQGLREYREAGGKIRDAVWYRLHAEQQASVGNRVNEMTAPLSSVPSSSDIIDMTTKRRSGYLQIMEIYTRVKGTDIVTTRPFMLTGSELLSRGEALTKALTMMQQAVDEERYEEVLLGGVYTGTRRMTVGDVA